MAYRAGAKVANVEFLSATLVPKGYGIPGMAALMGMGGYLINAAGQQFMSRYHPRGERAPRPFLIKGVLAEMREGRGPCYVDCRHLPDSVKADLLRHLMLERGMWEEYFELVDLDLRDRPMEMEVSELSCVHGVLIDENCAASLPGLYAAGESAGATSLSRCTTEGYRAGLNAARYAQDLGGKRLPPEPDQVEEARARVERLSSSRTRKHYRELEDSVRQIMNTYVGLEKDERGLNTALKELEALRDWAGVLAANNPHEVVRSLEAQNLFEFATLATVASLERKESRQGSGAGAGAIFWRSDYPETSPEWEKLVTIRLENGKRVVAREPVPA